MGKVIFSAKEKDDLIAYPLDHDVEWPNKIHKPVGGGKLLSLALSFSKLSQYQQCPRRFYEQHLTHNIPYTDTPATLWGTQVHQAHENYLLKGQLMDAVVKEKIGTGVADMLKKKFNNLVAEQRVGIPLFGEQEWAIKADGKVASWFDTSAVFMRGKTDLGMGSLKKLYLYDYKTGKDRYPKTDQLDLMSVMAKAQPTMQHYTQFDSALIFLEAGTVKTHTTYLHEEGHAIQMRKFLRESLRIIDSYERDYWPEQTSPLCAYCPVMNCPFNATVQK
ncbi:PD-(D/E)XK nuclease family protein [Xenorhabdus sp. KK7.4]|uniref:PD-(D/E)XK nuclease family protein n=1 Tax=Xenorhabdus sp. KK7.4 TaxID=1851572 RepID=UPI000C03A3A3|nr:PD-(D/E)XK nuclease family protein [Xenorhabdus sp. KK7.4]PHM52126.1 hypothetical protein Xekk_03351 [Xenorhabdus sp. KK7.4]